MADNRYNEIMSDYERLKRKNRHRLIGVGGAVVIVGSILAAVNYMSNNQIQPQDTVTINEVSTSQSNQASDAMPDNPDTENNNIMMMDAEAQATTDQTAMPSENNLRNDAIYSLKEGQETIKVVDESGNESIAVRASNTRIQPTNVVNISPEQELSDNQNTPTVISPVERAAFVLSNGKTYHQAQMEQSQVDTSESTSPQTATTSANIQTTPTLRRPERLQIQKNQQNELTTQRAQENRESVARAVVERRRQQAAEAMAKKKRDAEIARRAAIAKAEAKREAEREAAIARSEARREAERRAAVARAEARREAEREAAERRRQQAVAAMAKKKRDAEIARKAAVARAEARREAERAAAERRRQQAVAAMAKKKRDAEMARKAAVARAEAEKRRIEMSKASVQAGAYKTPTRAKQVQQELANLGYSSYVNEVNVKGGKVYSVRTGTFPNQKEARIAVSRIQSRGLDGKVISHAK